MDTLIIGNKIAALRKSQGLTQQQLADILSVTNKAVSKWESGGGLPDIRQLPSLACALGVSIDQLISEKQIDSSSASEKWWKTKSAKKAAVGVAALIVLAFGIYNAIWFYYMHHAFSPFLDTPKAPDGFVNENGWTGAFFAAPDSDYLIQVNQPPYLVFNGDVGAGVVMYRYPSLEEYSIRLFITPKLTLGGVEHVYELELRKTGVSTRLFRLPVDEYFQPLERGHGVSEIVYDTWLELYNALYDEIMVMAEHMRGVFYHQP
ncbi:MAG: helix-turn-helix domain-containing protein [Oscillospiraceae bacterium]|nr:helix-turn-helix domain-containing protein [Oscillospiraceae bacterium]